jgi:hypothetical protein
MHACTRPSVKFALPLNVACPYLHSRILGHLCQDLHRVAFPCLARATIIAGRESSKSKDNGSLEETRGQPCKLVDHGWCSH